MNNDTKKCTNQTCKDESSHENKNGLRELLTYVAPDKSNSLKYTKRDKLAIFKAHINQLQFCHCITTVLVTVNTKTQPSQKNLHHSIFILAMFI